MRMVRVRKEPDVRNNSSARQKKYPDFTDSSLTSLKTMWSAPHDWR
jgi:hypothetical protein